MKTQPLRDMDEESAPTNKEFKLVGFVTDVENRMTKTNKPFGKVTMLDYTGAYTFTVFGKDYTDHKNLYEKGYSIMVSAKFSESRYDASRKFFSINTVKLLSEIKEDFFNNITFAISHEKINSAFIDQITEVVKKNKGKINLNFKIYNNLDESVVSLFSRTERVTLSDEIIDFLENNPHIENVKLN